MSKRYESLHAKVSHEAKAAVIEKARRARKSVSQYLVDAALAEESPEAEELRELRRFSHAKDAPPAKPAEPLRVYHVDDLGHDPWRRDNGALQR